LNSFHMPLGGGGGGAGLAANSSRICLSSFSISSSFDIISPIYIATFRLLTSFVPYKQPKKQ
jgi:hypothetical protein